MPRLHKGQQVEHKYDHMRLGISMLIIIFLMHTIMQTHDSLAFACSIISSSCILKWKGNISSTPTWMCYNTCPAVKKKSYQYT
jgi:hypothetical protein